MSDHVLLLVRVDKKTLIEKMSSAMKYVDNACNLTTHLMNVSIKEDDFGQDAWNSIEALKEFGIEIHERKQV